MFVEQEALRASLESYYFYLRATPGKELGITVDECLHRVKIVKELLDTLRD